VPDSKLYNQMQELERRLDATIMRKTLDIQDALAKPPKVIGSDLESESNIKSVFVKYLRKPNTGG
jgi:SWI/SNF-related matrix-associated actin-dependent regulator of chromatin subfamily D